LLPKRGKYQKVFAQHHKSGIVKCGNNNRYFWSSVLLAYFAEKILKRVI